MVGISCLCRNSSGRFGVMGLGFVETLLLKTQIELEVGSCVIRVAFLVWDCSSDSIRGIVESPIYSAAKQTNFSNGVWVVDKNACAEVILSGPQLVV